MLGLNVGCVIRVGASKRFTPVARDGSQEVILDFD